METYRQGDVLLIKVTSTIASIPVKRDDKNRIVLALGEATGHAHVIEDESAEMVSTGYSPTSTRFIKAPEGATVTHEEHAEVKLPAGIYEVRMQREATPADDRRTIQRAAFD